MYGTLVWAFFHDDDVSERFSKQILEDEENFYSILRVIYKVFFYKNICNYNYKIIKIYFIYLILFIKGVVKSNLFFKKKNFFLLLLKHYKSFFFKL